MCAPAALLVASMAFTAVSGYMQAEGAKAEGRAAQEVAKQNAELDDFRAKQAATIGAIEEERHRGKVRQMVGTQRANFAANGVDLGSGVVEAITDETTTMGETDALTLRFNAMNEAWGFRTQAVNSRNQGRMARWSGNQQARGTWLTTAGNLASMGYQGYQSGAFRRSQGGG
jgi:hypothetical protein